MANKHGFRAYHSTQQHQQGYASSTSKVFASGKVKVYSRCHPWNNEIAQRMLAMIRLSLVINEIKGFNLIALRDTNKNRSYVRIMHKGNHVQDVYLCKQNAQWAHRVQRAINAQRLRA